MSEEIPASEAEPEAPHSAEKSREGTVGPEERAGYLGYVAHEIRNPLSTGLWSAELLGRLSAEDRGGARGEKLAAMCLRALQRMRLLIEDHFVTERLAVGGLPIRRTSVPLRELVQAVAPRASVASLALDGDEESAVLADRMLLERALEGLLAAAARDRTPVRVEVLGRGTQVEIRIQGAPPATPGALEMPQKGSASDTTGRSLALYMATEVAAAMEGTLRLEDDSFVLVLPAAASPA